MRKWPGYDWKHSTPAQDHMIICTLHFARHFYPSRGGEGVYSSSKKTCRTPRGKLAVTDKGKLDHQPLFAKGARVDTTYIPVQCSRRACRGDESGKQVGEKPLRSPTALLKRVL